jgi:hypothetical protein
MWNYRVVRKKQGEEVQYGIHEVYYENNVPWHCTKNPVAFVWYDEDNALEILEMVREGMFKPVLDYDDF